MWKPCADHVEQSSDDIWFACCRAVRRSLRIAGLDREAICGIGFDATCSLVALDNHDHPVSLSSTGRMDQNIIVWMDHRAVSQAERVNATRHRVLRYVGGVISPEMQVPKLLWIKEHLPDAWAKTARFLDLPDFLTYRATGDDTRSLCSVVCKWNYLGQKGADGAGWPIDFLKQVGLIDLVDEQFSRIGQSVRPMGEPIAKGLTSKSARELGLAVGTPVGVSIIDAHAGGLGMLGASIEGIEATPNTLNSRMALIGGTSSCHMAVSELPRFIRGIWGPYHSAMVPGLWLTEGGQSASGALIDHVISSHAVSATMQRDAKRLGVSIYDILNAKLDSMEDSERVPFPAALSHSLHVQPDFHGNRSPRADPTLRGVISGLTLASGQEDLARLYLATIQAIAFGTRHIIEVMNSRGYAINTIMVCGGGTKNSVFLREHADITGCRLVLPREPEAVLLGAAVLGAVASGRKANIMDAMKALNATGKILSPLGGRIAAYHSAKYRVFHRMHADWLTHARFMKGAV